MKLCIKCGLNKSLDCFSRSYGKPRGACKKCISAHCRAVYAKDPTYTRARNEEWRKKNPEKLAASYRKNKYAITEDEYNALLVAQKGACAICGGPPKGKSTKYLSVDHCHASGIIRGLLCTNCNAGLGNLKDSVELLEKSIAYLKQFLPG